MQPSVNVSARATVRQKVRSYSHHVSSSFRNLVCQIIQSKSKQHAKPSSLLKHWLPFFKANPEVIKLSQPSLLLLLLLLFILSVYLLQHIDAIREQQLGQELFFLLLLGVQWQREILRRNRGAVCQ